MKQLLKDSPAPATRGEIASIWRESIMKAGRMRWPALAGLALACAAGCLADTNDDWLTVNQGSAQGDVTLYRDVHFEDIPIPQEYQLLPRESYSFQGGIFRNGIFKYEGPLEWTQAIFFFRNQLPSAGWELEKTEKGWDLRVLYFRKGEEKLIITVRQLRTGSRAELQLDNINKNDLLLKGKLKDMHYRNY